MFKIKIDAKPGQTTPEVAPPLVNVLLSVYNTVPSLQFEVLRDDIERSTEIEDTKYLRFVTIFHGFQRLGTVTYIKREHRGEKKHVFAICNDNIKKKRGSRDEAVTENPRVAVKKIIEFFKPKSLDFVGTVVHNEVSSKCYDLLWMSRREVFNSYNKTDDINIRLIGFAVDVASSDNAADVVMPAIIKSIVTDKLRDNWHTYEIISDVHSAIADTSAVAVKHMRDGSYVMVDKYLQGKSESFVATVYRSREEIPQPYLDKINMLQFVELNQPIRNVGVRMENSHEEALYAVLGGDIITDS